MRVTTAGSRLGQGLWLVSLAGLVAAKVCEWLPVLELVFLVVPVLAVTALVSLWPVMASASDSGTRFVIATGTFACLGVVGVDAAVSLSPGRSGVPPAKPFVIVSHNVFKENPTPARALDWLRAANPDMIVLSEASGKAATIPQQLADHYPFRVTCSRNGRCSTMIVSRVAPTRMIPLARGDAENRRALSAAAMVFEADGRRLAVVGVHLSRGTDHRKQQAELGTLAAALIGMNPTDLVVAGDFNASPLMPRMQRFARRLAIRPTSGLTRTWPANGWMPALFPFDQLWASPRLGARLSRVGPAGGSDHMPLTLEIDFAS